MKYIKNESTDPFYNLALEEYVLKKRVDDDYLLLWRNAPTIVAGRYQNTAEEINCAFVEEKHIHVVRRNSGGGAVYHDLGNLNFSFITALGRAEEMTIERFTRPVVDALCALGVDAAATGRNDIMADGRKISGNAQLIHGDRLLHHGTLLYCLDMDMAAAALQVSQEKFRSDSVKSVRSRIGNLIDLLGGRRMDILGFRDYLLTRLSGRNMTECELDASEQADVIELRDKKYKSWDWNYGESPAFDFFQKNRYAGGGLEVHLNVLNGAISDCRFAGDFLARRSLDEVTGALRGCRYTKKDVRKRLTALPLEDYFGSITLDEILSTMLDNQ